MKIARVPQGAILSAQSAPCQPETLNIFSLSFNSLCLRIKH